MNTHEDIMKFEDAKSFVDAGEFGGDFQLQDKITTKITAKGEIQAEVRIGGILTTNKDIDECLGKHKYAWVQLKMMFPNLVQPKSKEEIK